MPSSRMHGVHIAGITTCVPGPSRAVEEDAEFSSESVAKVSQSTGVRRRHLATRGICTSDLCFAAAENLLRETEWDRSSVDALILVTQTPDHLLPATACTLHGRLGLSPKCAAFDVNLGCSGYVYGLWLASSLISSGLKRVILLAGDTISRIVSTADKSVALLFGDAGSATAIEASPGSGPWWFELGTDGTGAPHLCVPGGGFRSPSTEQTRMLMEREGGNRRSEENLFMDGGEVFAFTLSTVPRICRTVLEAASWNSEDVTGFVMHQANRFMLRHLGKQMGIPDAKLVIALEEFGNTSCASIPLAMSSALAGAVAPAAKFVFAGFGVGFSFAAVAIELGPLILRPPYLLQCD